MSATDTDAGIKAINDARALLASLVAGDMVEVHVISGDTEIFIARQDGGANPMRIEQAIPPAPIAASTQATDLNAPHIATLVDAITAGSIVAAGGWIATLRVLEEAHEITAPAAGRISEVFARQGDLLEFGMRIASMISDE